MLSEWGREQDTKWEFKSEQHVEVITREKSDVLKQMEEIGLRLTK